MMNASPNHFLHYTFKSKFTFLKAVLTIIFIYTPILIYTIKFITLSHRYSTTLTIFPLHLRKKKYTSVILKIFFAAISILISIFISKIIDIQQKVEPAESIQKLYRKITAIKWRTDTNKEAWVITKNRD